MFDFLHGKVENMNIKIFRLDDQKDSQKFFKVK